MSERRNRESVIASGYKLGKLTEVAAPSVSRDWISEAHLIARTVSGVGNPLDLTIAEFEVHLSLAMRGGEIDDRDWSRRYVEDSTR